MAAVEGASGAISVDGLLAGLPGVRFDSTASATTLAETAELILNSRAADAELSRISRARVENQQEAENPSSEANVREGSKEPEEAARTDHSTAAPAADYAGPTHILIDSRAYLIGDQSTEAKGFGLVIEGDKVQVAEDFRSQVNVLSTESNYDQLHVGCRLYRNDGTEALLIHVEG